MNNSEKTGKDLKKLIEKVTFMCSVTYSVDFVVYSTLEMSKSLTNLDEKIVGVGNGKSTPLSPTTIVSGNFEKSKINKLNTVPGTIGPGFKSDSNLLRNNMAPIQEGRATSPMLNCYSLIPGVAPRRKSMYTLSTPSQDCIAARRLSHNRITAM